jgi:hypothetical protein
MRRRKGDMSARGERTLAVTPELLIVGVFRIPCPDGENCCFSGVEPTGAHGCSWARNPWSQRSARN